MENIGEIYYQRGIRFFELEQYENAVTDLISFSVIWSKKNMNPALPMLLEFLVTK